MSDDEAPMYPLIAFGAGLADGQIRLELELATDLEQYESREGSVLAIVMTPDHTVELARTLIERTALRRSRSTRQAFVRHRQVIPGFNRHVSGAAHGGRSTPQTRWRLSSITATARNGRSSS